MDIITIPTSTDFLTQLSENAGLLFDALWKPAVWVAGLIIGVLLVRALMVKAPLNAVKNFTGQGRNVRRGRRR